MHFAVAFSSKQQLLLRCFSQEKDPSNLTCVSSVVLEKNQSFIYLLLWSAVVVTSSGVDFITVHSNGHKLISSVGFYWGNCGISAVVLMFELTQRSSQTSSSRFHISCNIQNPLNTCLTNDPKASRPSAGFHDEMYDRPT